MFLPIYREKSPPFPAQMVLLEILYLLNLDQLIAPEQGECISIFTLIVKSWKSLRNIPDTFKIGDAFSVSASCRDLVMVISILEIEGEIFLGTTWEPGYLQN